METKYIFAVFLFVLLGMQVNAQKTQLSDVPAFSCAYDALDATTKLNRTTPNAKLFSYLELNEQQCAVDESNSRTNVFVDKTAIVLKVKRGATYSLKLKQKAIFQWMHTCLWIDYNQDGVFSKEAGYTVDDGSELVDFDFFSNNAESNTIAGINSRGKQFPATESSRLGFYDMVGTIYTLPQFTIPADAPTGQTRMRFICNWGSIDPSGLISGNSTGGGKNTAANVAATIVDVTLNIEDDTYPVTFTQPDSQYGTLTIKDGDKDIASGDPVKAGTTLTIEATPSSNEYAVKSILVNGDAITDNTYTVQGNTTVSAEFIKGRWLTYAVNEGGAFTIKKGTTEVASETAVELGSTLQLTFAPNIGYKLKSFMVNGQDMTADVANGSYTISSVTENINLQVVFAKKTYKFSYSFNSLGNVLVKAEGIVVKDGEMIPYNTLLNISVIPGTQSFVKSVLLDGVEKMDELLPDGNSSFTLTITQETSLKIEFDATKYTFSCNTPLYGTMKVVNSEDAEHVYSNGDQYPFGTSLNIYLNAVEEGELLELKIDEGAGPTDYFAEGYVEKLDDGTYYTYLQAFNNVSIDAKFKEVANSIEKTSLNVKVYIKAAGSVAIENAPVGSLINVYNVTGQEIAKAKVQQNIETIAVQAQSIYLIKISNSTSSVVKKLVK